MGSSTKRNGGWAGKGSRHERGYGTAWDKTRLRILARDSHLCQVCIRSGRPTPATEVDHVTPKAGGGTEEDENLQAICTPCHKAKTKAEAHGQKARLAYDANGFPMWPA